MKIYCMLPGINLAIDGRGLKFSFSLLTKLARISLCYLIVSLSSLFSKDKELNSFCWLCRASFFLSLMLRASLERLRVTYFSFGINFLISFRSEFEIWSRSILKSPATIFLDLLLSLLSGFSEFLSAESEALRYSTPGGRFSNT